MNNFNPMLDYQRNQLIAQQAMIQNQLNQINHMNPPVQQFNPYPQNNPQFFVRQVGSVDEAKSFPVDPATIYFFPDTGTGKIYMKRLNTDNGKSEFFTYNLQENFETEKVSVDPMEQINKRLTNIENIIGGIYDKSVSNDENNSRPDGNSPTTGNGKVQKSKSTDVQSSPTDDKGKE